MLFKSLVHQVGLLEVYEVGSTRDHLQPGSRNRVNELTIAFRGGQLINVAGYSDYRDLEFADLFNCRLDCSLQVRNQIKDE